MVSNIAMGKSYIVIDGEILLVDSLTKYYQYIDLKYLFTDHTVILGRWIDMITFPYDVQDHDRLRGLSLAIHIIKQLTNNHHSNIIDIASKYDCDENFVMSVIDFLKDIRWLSQDQNGKYIVTEQGLKEMSHLMDGQQS